LWSKFDGGTHVKSSTDAIRDEWMQAQGIQLLRVWNNDVMMNMDGVLEMIRSFANGPLPPAPSRNGRGR